MTKPWVLPAAPILKDWNGVNTYGQSLALGDSGTPALSTSQPYNNLLTTGPTTTTPLVETSQESPESGIANYAVQRYISDNGGTAAGFVVVGSPQGNGGTPISGLVAQPNGAGDYHNMMINVAYTASAASAAGKSCAYHAFGWAQGESDTTTDEYVYAGLFDFLQSTLAVDLPALSGQSVKPYILSYQTPEGGGAAFGQFRAADRNPYIWLVAPCYHLPFIVSNGLHLTNVGYLLLGNYIGRAFKQLVIDKRPPDCIWPTAAYAYGTTISVYYRFPTWPLVFDTSNLVAVTNNGYSVSDKSGALTLSNIQVVNGDFVQMTTNRPVDVPSTQISFGGTYNDGSGTNKLGGNLRDSTPDTVTISGTPYNLWHVSPVFNIGLSVPQILAGHVSC